MVQQTEIVEGPLVARRALAAWTTVPAVSTMSSRRSTFLPFTLPMMFITWASLVLPGACR